MMLLSSAISIMGGTGGGGGKMLKFASEIDGIVLSFLSSMRSIGSSMRSGIAIPYRDACDAYRIASSGEYATYLKARSRCVTSRSSALLARAAYVDRARELENAIRSLRRAVRMSRRRDAIVGGVLRRTGRGSSRPSSPSNDDNEEIEEEETKKKEENEENEEEEKEKEGEDEEGDKEEKDEREEKKEEQEENEEKEKEGSPPLLSSSGAVVVNKVAVRPCSTNDAIAPTLPSSTSDLPRPWEGELHKLADRFKLSRQVCESVTRLHDDVTSAREEYAMGVLAENEAVKKVQALERMALDCLQRLEEVRGMIL